ncbi:MAG: DNA polymerase III subunit alpha [Pseudomonadales bacterium]|nr:DNA polymerase III subunit alpha [Pseudomonadales bacterium]
MTNAPSTFVHLRAHTEFSLVDGILRIKPFVNKVVESGMPAVAITDVCNLFAAVKFQRACEGAGVKPIMGVDVLVESSNPNEPPTFMVLLAQNLDGYRNLTELVSEAYLTGQGSGKPVATREWLKEKSGDLICLSGGKLSEIGQALVADKIDKARSIATELMGYFEDRFYIELQRTGRSEDETYLHRAVELASELNCPVVATNDVRFLNQDDYDAHEVRVCIKEGWTLDDSSRPTNYSDQQYLRTPEEMIELFSDIPEAIENTIEIAKRCSLEIPLGTYYLPDFPVPEGMTIDSYLEHTSKQGLEERLDFLFDRNDPNFEEIRKPYDERLRIELDVIIQMGFPGYFLIVADFIQWSKNNGVPVGPGRGSGAGSLVAYAIKITDLDPLEYDLLFERFLNPERVSMPDFDVDFCMDGRDRVIDYVAEKYGRNAVCQIITYGTMAAKAVVRDVGRVQGKGYGFVDRIAKLIPFEVGMTLSKAMEQEEQLQDLFDNDDEVRELLAMALKLEGITRNVGKHAGGVVIAPSKLTDYVPLYCDEEGNNLVTQFDKDDVESAGLVKFDFLGLRTLTIVDWALQTINPRLQAQSEEPIDIMAIPLDDAPTFNLLQAAETTAVFQLESRGMKDLIKRLRPSSFEDIVALVALFRPGPLGSGMVDDFIARKHGRQKVDYPHPDLEPVLNTTYGTILYQEQVMLIPQVLADFTLGGADLLRRAMGKKKADVMAQQRAVFVEGSGKNGISEQLATEIFDTMEEFAKYGFNKSHSAAYALVSYQTAWLKAHYPEGFMAAVLSADMHNTDKVVTLIDECNSMKLSIVPPGVDDSEYKFTVNDEASIVYGLGAIKGLGEGPIEAILEARKEGGKFADLFEFCRRVDLKKINRRSMEALVKAGALDALGPDRATLMATLPEATKAAEQHAANEDAGMGDLFGEVIETESSGGEWTRANPWSDDERLQGEKETLGLYLTGHPIDQYLDELSNFISCRINDVKPGNNRDSRTVISGLVIAMRVMRNKRGDRMCFVTLDDKSGRMEVSVFSDTYEQYKDLILKDAVLVVEGEVSNDEYSGGLKMVTRKAFSIGQARENYARMLTVSVNQDAVQNGFSESFESLLAQYRDGECRMRVDYQREGAKARFYFNEEWKVRPAPELIEGLENLCGEKSITVQYR